ncbi:MAG: DUF4190 domain-containing protein [Candidatus Omnitrophica bacterium]|nr:DUF4190 domain-containing protein [Candidatus Omnitrophota bacterium]
MSELQKRKTHGLAVTSLVLGCFFLVPLLGFALGFLAVIFGIIALVSISNNKQAYKGSGMAIAGLIMGVIGIIIVPIIAILLAIAIPNFVRASLSANEAGAQANLTAVSAAATSYRATNGRYPREDSDLLRAVPPYLSVAYNGKTIDGYTYTVIFTPDSYKITAVPETCNVTGKKVFIVRDGEFSESDCK